MQTQRWTWVFGSLVGVLGGCSTVGDAASTPFYVADLAVFMVSLGTVDMGLSDTVRTAVDKGEVSFRGRIGAPPEEMVRGMSAGVAQAGGNYAGSKGNYAAQSQLTAASQSILSNGASASASSEPPIQEATPSRLVMSARPSGACQRNMRFLDAVVPAATNEEINDFRGKAINTDVMADMRRARRQGYTPSTATKAIFSQAREYDKAAAEALRTASLTDALGNSDDDFLVQLKGGTLSVKDCLGIRNNALCQAIRMRIAAVVTRAEAAEFVCHGTAGTFPPA
ncbi:hypothetical protein QTI33_07925 [Variovorax sp. J22P271]|uniref:hypothetical protein n=1 Tax=Variovorax davisae TaxID=3053515 RepID=UPI002575E852|nr:hypothetical protein [Variovorax sp. J22P271]MDM0032069.1 hypothetical protein [Variovorax sp. J22P271]